MDYDGNKISPLDAACWLDGGLMRPKAFSGYFDGVYISLESLTLNQISFSFLKIQHEA